MKPRVFSTARLSLPLASALAALLTVPSASATPIWWDGGTANWATLSAWTTTAAAATPDPLAVPGSADDLTFNRTGINTANIITLAAAQAAKSLTFGSTGTSIFRANASGTTARILSIGTGGITINSGAGAVTIGDTPATYGAINITLSGAQAWTNNSGNTFTFAGNVVNGANLLTIAGSGNTTLSGLIGNGAGGIIKDGTGTLALSNNSNSFSGGLTIKNGVVNLGSTGGAVGSSALTMGGTGSSGATLIGNTDVTRALTVNAPTSGVVTLAPNTLGNSLTYSGAITLAGDLTVRAFFSGTTVGTGNTTVTGGITGTGNLILSNTGTGAGVTGATSKIVVSTAAINHVGSITARGDNTGAAALTTISANIGSNVTSFTKEGVVKVLLSGNNSTYTGGFNISAGTLELGSTGALNSTAGSQNAVAFTSGSTGTLALNGNSVTIGNLSTHATPGTTFVQNGHATTATTLTVGNSQNLSGTYAGLIRNGAVGTLALTKAGGGTLTLGGKNTFTGNVNVTGGTLVANVAATGANTALGNAANTRTVTVGTGATLRFDVANVLSTTFSSTAVPTLLITGTATNNIAGNNALGNVTLTGGTLTATAGHANYGAFNLNGTITSTGTSTISASGGAKMMLTSAGANLVETASTFDVQSGTLTASADLSEVTTESKISGLTKIGTGTLVLSGINTYTGATTVTAGILQPTLATALAGYTTAGKVVFNGGTIATTMGDGSLTGWSTAQVDSLLVNATKISGALGIDTTNGSISFAPANLDSAIGLTKLGTNTLTLNGANTYSGTTTISAGTLRLENTGALGTSPLVSIGGNTLQIATDAPFAGPNISMQAGTIVSDVSTLNNPGVTHVLGNAVIGNGLSNFTAGSNVLGGTAAIQLGNITNDNGSTATPGLNPTTANLIVTGSVTLGVTNAGTANFTLGGTGSTNSIAGGIANGTRATGNVIKSGTSTWTLSGLSATPANNYNGTTTIGQGTLAITHVATANLTGGLTFGASSGSTNTGILDLTSGSASFASLLVQTNTASSNTLTIGSGRTLTINGNVTVGANIANAVASLVTTGGGDLVVGTGGNNTFIVGGASGATLAGSTAVDLSSLASLTVDYGSGGTFRLGDNNSGSNGPAPSTLKLATDNTITVGNFRIGDSSGGNSTHVLTLGNGANLINATTTNIGSAGGGIRSGGSMIFDPADTTGSLTLNGFGGAGTRTILNMINTTGNTAVGMTSIMNLAGHTANVNVSTLTMATRAAGAGGTSTLTFDQGVLDVTTLNMANRSGSASGVTATVNLGDSVTAGVPTVTIGGITMAVSASSSANIAIADLNISGGNVAIGTGSGTAINMANAVTGATATSALNITGGTVTLSGNIIRTVGGGTETATLTLNGASATLDMGGNDIGAAGAGAITLTAESGTLKNVASINGTGGLTKTTIGTLLLQGTNGYSGDTLIDAGTLQVQGGSAISNSGAVILADNVTAQLQLLSDETIGSLAGGGNTGGTVLMGSNHLTAGDASNTTFAGSINGGLSSKLTKVGAGTLTLSGTNAYDDTRVSLGTLLTTKAAALPAYNLNDRIDVDGGATLAVRAGGAGEWVSGEIDSLIATNSFTSGSNLGVDVTTGNTFTYSSDVGATQAAKGLVKTGAGTLVLDVANTYTGATVVQGGTLAINGSNVSTSISVQSGATLQGNGSTSGAVTINSGGTLASGNSIESLATGELSYLTGSNFQYELDKDATANLAGDLTAVTGNLSLSGSVTLSLLELGTVGSWELGSPLGDALTGSPIADKLTLISYTGSWNGGLFTYLGNLVQDDSAILLNGQQWWFNYNDTNAGTNFTGDLTGSSFVTMTVPEPRAALLGGLGLLALLRRRR